MNGEKKIIIAGVTILIFGVAKGALDKKPLDVPIIGGLTFILLLSLVAAFSDAMAELAGDFALLGMATVLLVDGPEVLASLPKTANIGSKPTQGSGTNPGGTGKTGVNP